MEDQNYKNSWRAIYKPGTKFHYWTIIRHSGMHQTPCGQRRSKYLVRCVCGTEKELLGCTLSQKVKPSTNCGCKGRPRGRRHVEIGEKFGRWKVQGGPYNMKDNQGRMKVYYQVECECGTVKWKIGNDIWRGRSRSCGCWQKELAVAQLEKIRKKRWATRDHQSPISEISDAPLDKPLEKKESSISGRLKGRDLLGQLASTVRGVI